MGLSNPTALPNGEASSPNSHSEPAFPPPPPRWIQAYSQFSRSVATYLWHGPASDSWTANRVGLESFIDFVWLHPAYRNEENSVLPATERAIMEWIASLGARNVRTKTLKYYLNDIRAFHVDAGYPTTVCESPVVQRLIRGIKRVHEERLGNPKLPITIDVLRQLCAAVSSDRLQDVVFKAAFTVAFAAFLRLSEFTVPVNAPFDPSTHLSRGCVEFLPNASSPTHVALSLPASKADPFRKRATILVAAAPDAVTCPVAALKTLFERDPRPPSAPLFSDCAPGQLLTREFFTLFCYINLSFRGVDITGHSGISFRRGAALAAGAVGYSENEIRLLGRWRSDADKLYREVAQDRILHLSARLHSTDFLPQTS
ncbi:hypothetical protein V8D89_008369 [Ganoderma adspersum]